jgi:hypothetical protein
MEITDHSDRGKAWPHTARGVAGTLQRLAPALRLSGVAYTARKTNGKRLIELRHIGGAS